jgi:transposase-like protein
VLKLGNLWRAVGREGEVLEMLVQRRGGMCSALGLMRKLLKKQAFTQKLLVDRQAALLRHGVPVSTADLP